MHQVNLKLLRVPLLQSALRHSNNQAQPPAMPHCLPVVITVPEGSPCMPCCFRTLGGTGYTASHNQKCVQIMAQTAAYVRRVGRQSEFVLRVKQGDNPVFGFLMPAHWLHPYFRWLVDSSPEVQLRQAEWSPPGNPAMYWC